MTRVKLRKERLSLRLAPDTKMLIERAASRLGQTVSDFAVSRLVRAARDVLREQETTTLSNRDRRVFLAMLDAGAEPNAALRKAGRLYKRQRA